MHDGYGVFRHKIFIDFPINDFYETDSLVLDCLPKRAVLRLGRAQLKTIYYGY